MSLFKRTPREFEVDTAAEPWTINGQATNASTAGEALQEIYDEAVYFPITITVHLSAATYALEMDENMQTRPLDPVSLGQVQDEGSDSGQGVDSEGVAEDPEDWDVADELLGGANQDDAVEESEQNSELSSPALGSEMPSSPEDSEDDDDQTAASSWPKRWGKAAGVKLGAVVATALLVVAGMVFGVTQLLGAGHGDDARAEQADQPWATALPEASTAGEALDDQSQMKMWSLEPEDADTASWFQAGVVAAGDNDKTISLYDTLSGEKIASHKLDKGQSLSSDLQWATEFKHDGNAVVGLRIAGSFIAMTEAGEVQEWSVPDDWGVNVYGTTPVMTNAGSESVDEASYKALIIGEESPAELTINPDMGVRAVDNEDWILQLSPGKPKVALNPVDRNDEEMTSHAVALTAPTEDAEFERHLDAGHNLALALWTVGGADYIGVHELTGEQAGEAATFVKAPFSADDATSWTLSRGMNLALLGPYAISLSTGELQEHSDDGDFVRAYGPAAVTVDENDRRTFYLDGTRYSEANRIVGYPGNDTTLVRLPDGSVAAYGESEGKA